MQNTLNFLQSQAAGTQKLRVGEFAPLWNFHSILYCFHNHLGTVAMEAKGFEQVI